MAIIIEEEKKQYSHLSSMIVWVTVVAIILLAVYYVFFKRPDIIEISAPADFKEIEGILEIGVAPEEVVQSPAFQGLKLYTSPLVPSTQGKSNPFLGK